MPCGGLTLVARVGGEGGKIVFPRENLGCLTHQRKIEGTGHVPGPSDFEGMEGVGIRNPVKVGFALGREAGVEAGLFPADGEDAHAGGQMKVQSFGQGGRGMKRWNFTRGDLAESVDMAVCPSRTGDSHGVVEDFLKGSFEGELDGGVGVLALPTEEVFSAVGEKETVGNRLHARINGGRLRARDYRSSR